MAHASGAPDGRAQDIRDVPGGERRTADSGPRGDECPAMVTPVTQSDIRRSLRHLRSGVSNRVFAAKLLLCCVFIGGGAALAIRHELWERIAGVVLLGCMFAHASELQHQTLHGLGFRGRRANTAAGIALGVPMLVSFAAYRAAHLRHHRDLGTPWNQEFFDYGDQYGADGEGPGLRRLLGWLARFAMIYFWRGFAENVVRTLRGKNFEGESVTTSRRIRRDYYIILAVIAGMVGLSVAVNPLLIVWTWLAPLVLVTAPVHAAIELPEHFRCETSTEDPFANTRTIRSNRLMMWFTNGNNFHVEHHLVPNMPIERLPAVHREVRSHLQFFNPTYLDFFLSLRWR